MAPPFIHPQSDVQSSNIGSNTRIWQFCVVFPQAKIGANCNICAHVLIENDVVIGDEVTIKNGVQIWDGVRIGNRVFVGPNATFTNDLFPRSKSQPDKFLETIICDGVSIGANATILPGLTIGANSMIGAGAVITKNVPPNAIVVGNPGVIVGYVGLGSSTDDSQSITSFPIEGGILDLEVGGCSIVRLPFVSDMRGCLSLAEYNKQIPFVPKRCFWVFDVPNSEVRGEHAHKELHQFLICLKGSVSVVLDDASVRKEVVLNEPNVGLHIPPLVWGIQYKYSKNAILLVLASDPYDPDDYLRDYDKFVAYVRD